jgi:hypothetical protein
MRFVEEFNRPVEEIECKQEFVFTGVLIIKIVMHILKLCNSTCIGKGYNRLFFIFAQYLQNVM